MSRIISIDEIKNVKELSKICHNTNDTILVTKDSHKDFVVMNVEIYNKLKDKANLGDITDEVINNNKLSGASESLIMARKKYYEKTNKKNK